MINKDKCAKLLADGKAIEVFKEVRKYNISL